jgi:hypothetical protein
MSKVATAKLTSEERCRKAFVRIFSLPAEEPTVTPAGAFWTGWRECWQYLESRVEEFIQA